MPLEKKESRASRSQVLADAYELKDWLEKLDLPGISRNFVHKVRRLIRFLEEEE